MSSIAAYYNFMQENIGQPASLHKTIKFLE